MSAIDFELLKSAAEGRDATALARLYADDAEIKVVNKTTPPGSPRLIRGKKEISEYLEDVCSRDMTHDIGNVVVADDRISYTEACEYSSGEKVLTASVAEVDGDGKITSQLMVETWDE